MSEVFRSSAIRTYDCLGVLFCFFLVFLDIGVYHAIFLVVCVSFLFSWSFDFPFEMVAVLPISLLMKEPGIMMPFYDIPMLISCPTAFLLFLLFFYHEFCFVLMSQLQNYIP